MCNGPGRAASVTEALAMLDHALDYLADTDAASLPGDIQAEALRALERAQSKHTVARARILAAFASQATFEDDGHGSARTWLKWQARITTGAAAGAVDAAHDLAGYRRLRRLLRAWRLIAIAVGRAGDDEELSAVRNGAARTTPADEAIPGWQERLAAARAQRQ